MNRILLLLAALIALAAPGPAFAEQADIEAAARGVVRIVVIGRDGDEIFAVSHGSGFAVDSETIVTNAHVVREAMDNQRLTIGIVPSDAGSAVYARVIAVSDRNDLALLATTSPLRLTPLTIAGNPDSVSGTVTSIGYPMNVDLAQGLQMEDIFRAQPPVTSQGFLSGRRPSREFDTLLHTAPIARGNSGGPLVDNCGRVLGVNSFGAESAGTDAEFFFAVSTREILPFLRANGVSARINSLPCRSIDDLEAQERAREAQRQAEAAASAAQTEAALARRSEELRRQFTFQVMDERANAMGLAFLMLALATGLGGLAFTFHRKGHLRERAFAGAAATVALAIALASLMTRPGFGEIETRVEDKLHEEQQAKDSGPIAIPSSAGAMICVLDTSRSRVVSAPPEELPLEWTDSGCADGRTQFGNFSGDWSRVVVPSDEDAVSVNAFDPDTREYVVERYLLDREAMTAARAARGNYEAPQCGAGADAARELGSKQNLILSQLPDRPNERFVYACSAPQDDPPNQE